MINLHRFTKHHPAFTIVELAIVIAVVGILAAITILGYQAAQRKVAIDVLKSDLANADSQLQSDRNWANAFPANETAANNNKGLPKSPGTSYEYTYDAVNKSYCLTAKSNKQGVPTYIISSDDPTPREGLCPGHSAPSPGGGGNEIASNSPIQDVTPAQCAALPIYTGSNSDAVRTVTDSRGGTTRTYEIAKLADNNCWMLTNLKLGSTSGTTALTPSDTDISSNLSLPQAQTTGSHQKDSPRIYAPVPGDTDSGSANYGYLYNWSAATGGESRTSKPAGSGNAQHSICPANWRLPTGGTTSSDFGVLDIAFGGSGGNSLSGPGIAKWQYTGPFKGIFAGGWDEGFTEQSSSGHLWSASPHTSNNNNAFNTSFGPTSTFIDMKQARSSGFGIRCILR